MWKENTIHEKSDDDRFERNMVESIEEEEQSSHFHKELFFGGIMFELRKKKEQFWKKKPSMKVFVQAQGILILFPQGGQPAW